MTLIEERYELAVERLQEMLTEQSVSDKYADYFQRMAQFGMLLKENYDRIQKGWLKQASLEELRTANTELYEDILGENYNRSYADPAYACKQFGLETGRLLSFLYTELRCMILHTRECWKNW